MFFCRIAVRFSGLFYLTLRLKKLFEKLLAELGAVVFQGFFHQAGWIVLFMVIIMVIPWAFLGEDFELEGHQQMSAE